jgi:uncharacterized protein
MNNKRYEILWSSFLLALGISISGYFIGQTMYKYKIGLNTAEVKGLAEKRVASDLATWDITYSVEGKNKNEIPDLYKKAENNQKKIVDLLKQNGFNDTEITLGVIEHSFNEYRDEDQNLVDEKHFLSGIISIETKKVHDVNDARNSVNKLIAEGINIINKRPSFHFTKLNEIKPQMLKEAAKNARVAANEFADNAGVSVGGIRSARQGNFSVQDTGEESGYGWGADTKKIEKDVRVVTSISFYLTK